MNARYTAALLLTLVFALVVPPAQGQVAAAPTSAQLAAAEQPVALPGANTDAPRFVLASLKIGDYLFAAASPDRESKPKGGNKMTSTGSKNAVCEWFIITCNSGGGDLCCGSVSSCLGYCEELCGPPCVYNEQ